MKIYNDFIHQLIEAAKHSKEEAPDDEEEKAEEGEEQPKGKLDNVKKRTRRPIKFNRGEDDGQSLSPIQHQ